MGRHQALIRESLETVREKTKPPHEDWAWRHLAAMGATKTVRFACESAVSNMLYALAEYADAHEARYGSGIGEDGVLGDAWEQQVRGLRALLNGECGRLDCGTVDALLCAMLRAEGFEGA